MSRDEEIARFAESHHGVFTATHARAAGLSSSDIKWRVATGRWQTVQHGVYRMSGAPLSWRGELLAACWAGGDRAVASHRSAAKLWELPGGRDDLIEILCPRWRRARHNGLVVHESKALRALDITEVDGIAVTTVELTLLQLGAVYGPRTVERAVENGLRRDLVTIGSLRGLLHRVGRQGRDGVGVLRAILDERDPNHAPTDSDMETEVLQVLRMNGFPKPVPQYVIRDSVGSFIARVDLAIVEWKVALEYESIAWHTGKAALFRDNPRRRKIMSVDWKPLGVTVDDLRDGGRRLCADIRANSGVGKV